MFLFPPHFLCVNSDHTVIQEPPKNPLEEAALNSTMPKNSKRDVFNRNGVLKHDHIRDCFIAFQIIELTAYF